MRGWHHRHVELGHESTGLRKQSGGSFQLGWKFTLETVYVVVFVDDWVLNIELVHVHIFGSYLRHLGLELLLHHRLDILDLGLLALFNLLLSLSFISKRRIRNFRYFFLRGDFSASIWVIDQKFSFWVLCYFKEDLRVFRFDLCWFLLLFFSLLLSFSLLICWSCWLGIWLFSLGKSSLRLFFLGFDTLFLC